MGSLAGIKIGRRRDGRKLFHAYDSNFLPRFNALFYISTGHATKNNTYTYYFHDC
jgi:hypothetical protein